MNKKRLIIMGIIGAAIAGSIWYVNMRHVPESPTIEITPTPSVTNDATPDATSTPATDQPALVQESPPAVAESKPKLIEPIDQFKERITKKKFGTHVTPQNSPVEPEKFTGYHTGVDVEYEDVTADVPVKAIADGVVKLSRTASGYGGVMAVEHGIDGKKVIVIYGHLRPSSMRALESEVTGGKQIGVLGTAFSTETSGERRHLHFAIRANSAVDIKGYIQNKSELSGWQDPLSVFP